MTKYLIVPCSLWLLAGCASSDTKTTNTVKWNPKSFDVSGMHGDAGNTVTADWATSTASPSGNYAGQGGTGAGPIATNSISGEGEGNAVQASRTAAETADQANIDLYKEELVVGKREISNGGVLVRRVVQTENVSQSVDLRREEYVVERVAAPVSSEVRTSSQAFQEKEIYIPLTREEAVAGKRVLLTENIHIGKRVDTDHVTVTRPVRSEDVEVVKVAAKAAGISQAAPNSESASTEAASDSDSMKLAREELVVSKREVDNGGVKLQKVIRTQDASQGVDLKREEFTIDRQAMNNQVVDSAHFTPREIRIDLTREEAVPSTRGYLAETVRVRKQIQTDKQVVSGTMRRENIEIAKNGAQAGSISSLNSPTVAGQGGTGMAGQTGVSFTSESGYANQGTNISVISAESQDRTTTANVRAALSRGFSAKTDDIAANDYPNVEVSTHNGVVTLSGTVNSAAEKKLIALEVSAIDGVRSVKNDVLIAEKSITDTAK